MPVVNLYSIVNGLWDTLLTLTLHTHPN